ncbi:Doublesex- and mab-3-related transcription factor B1 [Lemmus lemmus]
MLRTPKCSRCRNHGYLVPVKGHAGKCRWKHCICDKCYLITERQKIMAAHKVLKTQAAEEQEVTTGTQGPQLPPGSPVAEAAASSSSSICPLPRVAPGGSRPGPMVTCFLERPPPVRSPGLSTFKRVPGGRPGPSTFQSGLGVPGGPRDRPSARLPQGSPQVPVSRPEPYGPEQRLPVRPVPRLPFTDYVFLGHPLRFSSDPVVGPGYPERESFNQCPACVPMPSFQPFPLDGQDASSAVGIPQHRSFRHVSCSPYHGGSLVNRSPNPFQVHPYPRRPCHFHWSSVPESQLS